MSNELKVVVLVDSLQNSYGTERAAVYLCNELSKYHRVSIVSIEKQNRKCSFELEKSVMQIDLGITSGLKPIKFYQMVWKLGRLSELSNADVLISTLSYISIILLIKPRKSQIICWEHASYTYFGQIMNAIRIRLYKNALAVITPTLSDSEAFRSKNLNAKSIANIVGPEATGTPSKKINNCFLFVGRLSKEKGIEELVEILRLFYTNGEDITSDHKTLIVGDGPLFEIVKKTIEGYSLTNRIKLIGRSDSMSLYYQNADILLCTSRSESFGMSIIEAAQHNIPTISFDDGEGPRYLIQNNITGFLIKSRNKVEFVEKLKSVHNNFELLQTMGQEANNNAKNFDTNKIMIKWIDVLSSHKKFN